MNDISPFMGFSHNGIYTTYVNAVRDRLIYCNSEKMQDWKIQEWKRNLTRNTNDRIVMLFSRL